MACFLNRRDVDKHVAPAALGLDEAIALHWIEPPHRPQSHLHFSPKKNWDETERDSSVKLAAARWQEVVDVEVGQRLVASAVNRRLPFGGLRSDSFHTYDAQ